MKLEKNDAWAVANEEIKTLQEIIQDANAKLQNQENELRREQDRGNELEQKIYEAQIKARSKIISRPVIIFYILTKDGNSYGVQSIIL